LVSLASGPHCAKTADARSRTKSAAKEVTPDPEGRNKLKCFMDNLLFLGFETWPAMSELLFLLLQFVLIIMLSASQMLNKTNFFKIKDLKKQNG